MTKKKIVALVAAVAVAGSVGYGLGAATKGAAESAKQPPMMMQGAHMGNMDHKAMADMMASPEMQKQCVEHMKSPEMQAAMKQMLQQDAGFHKMMLDMVNAVDATKPPAANDAKPPAAADHNAHHQ